MKKKFVITIQLFCILLVVMSAIAKLAQATEKVVMVSVRSENSYLGKFAKMIYTEAFKRMGKELEVRHFPAKPCSLLSDKGEVGGEVMRVHDYNNIHPNLLRVEESPFSIRWSAFAVDDKIRLNGWESLKSTDYKVEYMLGNKKPHEKLTEIVKRENLSTIKRWPLGLKKLIKGRTDIYIEIEDTITKALKRDEFRNSGIKLVGLMEENSIHAFLHKKHKTLVSKLSEILKKMREEGIIEKYKAEAFTEELKTKE